MTEPIPNIVARLQEQLSRFQGRSGEPPTGTGEALDGRLTITMASGKVSEVRLDPRAMRAASEDIADAIKDAINQAIEAHHAQLAAGLPATPSMDELARTLDEVTSDSMRALEESNRSMLAALDSVQRLRAAPTA